MHLYMLVQTCGGSFVVSFAVKTQVIEKHNNPGIDHAYEWYMFVIPWLSLTPYNSWENKPHAWRDSFYICEALMDHGCHVYIRQDINTSLVQKVFLSYTRYMTGIWTNMSYDRYMTDIYGDIPSLNFLGFPGDILGTYYAVGCTGYVLGHSYQCQYKSVHTDQEK
jgi:hypothetical protein